MKENIFLSLALDDSGRYSVLNINVLRGLPSLMSDINNNPGLLFLKCETTKQLYKAEIVKMEVIKKDKLSGTNDSKDVIYINFKNDLIKITLLKKQKAQQEELKLLYARSKKDFVGIYNHSLYYTYGRRKFKYARPVLANEIMKGELTPKLLENFYIIPEEDGTLFGKIIEEDNDYIVTLTNDRYG